MMTLNFYVFRISWVLILTGVLIGISSCMQQELDPPEYGWFDFVVSDLDTTSNAIDLSFLNEAEAGASGRVTVSDGHFMDGRGNRIRFFGDNLTFDDCFPQKDTARLIAARLARMGMNVIRFHHMDMRPVPGGIWNESMDDLDEGQLDKLDWLIYQLKLHGVYTNLNLHVSYTYPGVDYDLNPFNFGKAIDNFYRPYIVMQKEYARKLLTHVNPYTGNSYLEEPSVAFIEINNENSLLSNWRLLPQLNRDHKSALLSQWRAWLRENGHSLNRPDLYRIIEQYEQQSTREQKSLLWSFLVDTEMAYSNEMISYVRDELGAKALITNSQASYSGVAGVYREAKYSDFIDMHAYWEHPRFPGESWSRSNWLIRNSSMVSDKTGGTLKRFGQHGVEGMPLTISEYDHPAPNFFCAEMYPMLNSVAAFKDWDGIYHFTFNGPYDEGRMNGFFSSSGHPLKQIFIPVGAVMFRMGTIKRGENRIQLTIPEDEVVNRLVETSQDIRLHGSNMATIWEEAGAPEALTLMHPTEVKTGGTEIRLSQPVNVTGGPWTSETGELVWDNRDSLKAVFTVNAPAVKAAVGYIGGNMMDLGSLTIDMDSTTYNWAAITLTSLDGMPVEEASEILLVAAGRVENTDMGWNEEKTSVGTQWGNAPVRAEGIPAKISLSDVGRFNVYVLDPNGNRLEKIPVVREGNKRSFSIGAQYKTLWYLLER